MPRDPYTGRSTAPADGFDFEGIPKGRVDTSKAAADAIRPVAADLRERVLNFLRFRGATGATDQEIQDALSMDPSTQRPRRGELVEAGLVRGAWDGNGAVKRKTRAGRAARVWVAL